MMDEASFRAELKRRYTYDLNSGVFTRNISSNRWKRGDIAGWELPTGYRVIGIEGRLYTEARLAWIYVLGRWPEHFVDHINNDRNDNRWINLRPATRSENNRNAKLRKDNAIGHKNVCWHPAANSWVVQVTFNKERFCEWHKELDDAIAAADRLREKLHGDFANHGGADA